MTHAAHWSGLLPYLKPYTLILVIVLIFILVSTVLGLIGPYLMGQAIDKFIAVKKISGSGDNCLVDVGCLCPR